MNEGFLRFQTRNSVARMVHPKTAQHTQPGSNQHDLCRVVLLLVLSVVQAGVAMADGGAGATSFPVLPKTPRHLAASLRMISQPSDTDFAVFADPVRVATLRAIAQFASEVELLLQTEAVPRPIDLVCSGWLPNNASQRLEVARYFRRLPVVAMHWNSARVANSESEARSLAEDHLRSTSDGNQTDVLVVSSSELPVHGSHHVGIRVQGFLFARAPVSSGLTPRANLVFVRSGYGHAIPRGEIRGIAAVWAVLGLIITILPVLVSPWFPRLAAKSRVRYVVLSLMALGAGCVTTVVASSLFARWAPVPPRGIVGHLVWPTLLGVSLLTAPISICWFSLSRWAMLRARLWFDEAGRAIANGAALGVCVALGLPILVLDPVWGWAILGLAAASATLAVRVLVCAMDARRSPRPLEVLAAFIVVTLWGLGISLVDLNVLAVGGATALATTVLMERLDRKHALHDPSEMEDAAQPGRPLVRERLVLPYRDPSLDSMIESAATGGEFQATVWLRLLGPPDVAAASVEELARETQRLRGQVPLRISVACLAADAPLEPFLRAASDIAPGLAAGDEGRWLSTIGASLSRFVAEFPTNDESAPSTESLFQLFVDELVRRSSSQRLIVHVENAHWLDEASCELLRALRRRVVIEDSGPLVLISGEARSLDLATDASFSLSTPSDASLVEMLVQQLRFDPRSAKRIVRSMDLGGGVAEAPPKLARLKEVIDFLMDEGFLGWTHQEYRLQPEYLLRRLPPVPPRLTDSLIRQIDNVFEHRLLLQAAAALGEEFQLELLCNVMQRDRLEVFEAIGTIQARTGILNEAESENRFRFRSEHVYQVVCERLGITAEGGEDRLSHVQRELHRRAAEALRSGSPNDPRNVYALAYHSMRAGGDLADAGLRYSRQAAEFAKASYAFVDAEKYLSMASRCADQCEGHFDLKYEQLLLLLRRSHVTQTKTVTAAEKALEHRAHYQDDRFLLAAAQACYDARKSLPKTDPTFAKFGDRAFEIGQQLAESTAEPGTKARGLQFMALGRSPSTASVKHLERACELLSGASETKSLVVLSMIYCSLADELVRLRLSEQAQPHYERSLQLRREYSPEDFGGLARIHGGLGRCAFATGDYDTAEHHFRHDLDISQRLGDQRGVSQMHSWLGRCDLEKGRYAEAVQNFERSLRHATNPIDELYARAGGLEATARCGSLQEVERVGSQLVALLDRLSSNSSGFQRPAQEALGRAVAACRACGTFAWLPRIEQLSTTVRKRKYDEAHSVEPPFQGSAEPPDVSGVLHSLKTPVRE